MPEPKPLPPRAKFVVRQNIEHLREALKTAREASLLIAVDDKQAGLEAVHEISRQLEGVIISFVYLTNDDHNEAEATVVQLNAKRRE